MRQILSIILSLLLLVFSLGLTHVTHTCGHRITDHAFALGEASVGCGMEYPKKEANDSASDHFTKSTCCEDTQINFSVKNLFNSIEKNLLSGKFIAVFTYNILNYGYYQNVANISRVSRPPPVTDNYLVKIQVFLI